jgi:Rap1a immunity proteins
LEADVIRTTCYPVSGLGWTADDLLLGGYCGGFVGGVVDVLINKPNAFCVPQGPGGVRSAQLVEVVKLYLHDHPEKRNLAASLLVMQALKEKLPCPE